MIQPLEVGFGCNNACSFCAQGRLRTISAAPSTEQLLARISELGGGSTIAFVGGEPTLRADLLQLISAAKGRGLAVLLQTNGRRLAVAGFAQELADAGLSALDVSLHGSTEPMHDYHTGIEGSFRQTIAGLGRARAARLPFGITSVITRSSYRHLTEIARVAHTLGARAVHFAKLELSGRAADNAARLLGPAALIGPHLQRALEALSRLELDWLAAERASDPRVRDWFAGTGTTELLVSQRHDASRGVELQQAGVG